MGLCLQEDYNTALESLLVAEEAFQEVKTSLLESVDNQGMLCLDITW